MMLKLFYLGREKQYFIRCFLTEGGMPEKRISPLTGANQNSALRNIGFSNGSWQNCYATNEFRIPGTKPRGFQFCRITVFPFKFIKQICQRMFQNWSKRFQPGDIFFSPILAVFRNLYENIYFQQRYHHIKKMI